MIIRTKLEVIPGMAPTLAIDMEKQVVIESQSKQANLTSRSFCETWIASAALSDILLYPQQASRLEMGVKQLRSRIARRIFMLERVRGVSFTCACVARRDGARAPQG